MKPLAIALVICATAHAQDLPDLGAAEALETGERAPWAGMLLRDDDVYQLQSGLMQCRFALASSGRLHEQLLDARLTMERARTAAAVESAALHERLWTARAEQLARELAAAQSSASSWASPWLWGAIGLVVGVAASVAIAIAVGGG